MVNASLKLGQRWRGRVEGDNDHSYGQIDRPVGFGNVVFHPKLRARGRDRRSATTIVEILIRTE